MSRFFGSMVVGWLVALTIGLVGLFWYSQQRNPSSLPTTQPLESQTKTSTQTQITPPVSVADLAALQAKVDTLAAQVASQTGKTPAQSSQPGAKTMVQPARSVQPKAPTPARQFIIALGSAATNHGDWTPTSAEVSLDPSKYAKITGAHWEAAGSIVGGEVGVRLVDVTHARIYDDAPLVFNTSSPIWKQSAPITLSTAAAVYRLEIKSSSGEMAYLNDSRLVIETQ